MIPTRLYWHDGHGCCEHDGVRLILHEAPHGWEECDYSPMMPCEVRPERGGKRREMTGDEAEWCRQVLIRVAAAARRTYGWMHGDEERPSLMSNVTK